MEVAHQRQSRLLITNVGLAMQQRTLSFQDRQTFNVQCAGAIVEKISPYSEQEANPAEDNNVRVDGRGGMLLPSLCHSHIHLDKCNILSLCDDIVSGTFQEAMMVTAKAKAAFTSQDLISRGRSVVLESVKYGVTAMRAHVEVDTTVGWKCVEMGLLLKHEMSDICDIGIAVFAQEPLYPSDGDSENLMLLRKAVMMEGISTIGSAPYVESSTTLSHRNIDEILELSLSRNLHVDFHLDYNISPVSEPLIHYVIKRLRELSWAARVPSKRVTIGHATRISLFSPMELVELRDKIHDLPITFVALPQSDMYMMGRGNPSRPRGTLQVPELVHIGLDVAISVNNVGNAFTPQGSLDPLSLCPLGVAIYQTSTPNDCRTLLESVSITSKRAAGFSPSAALQISEGDTADFLIMHDNDTIQSLVLNPCYQRTVVKAGKVVAWKTGNDFVASSRLS